MASSSNFTLIFVLLAFQYVSYAVGQLLVTTNSGQLQGKKEVSREGLEFYSFKGIPYAEKPERFKVAQPVKPWSGVRDAGNYGPVCIQSRDSGSEDCLYLNVFTPVETRCINESDNGKLPVLFHIHGGGFDSAAGSYFGPKFLMDECIVYVSNNYRLGALGFLTTNDSVIPGNIGLKDSLLALKWINENIGFFRGDNGSITLNGISAGGATISHFIASPAAAGLFHRAIAQSGSSLDHWAVQTKPREMAFRLGGLLNCSASTSEDLLRCLRSVPAETIAQQQGNIVEWAPAVTMAFAPVVEPADSVEPFQTVHPYLRKLRGDFNCVPFITGFMRDEGLSFDAIRILRNKTALNELNSNWEEIATYVYHLNQLNVASDVRSSISNSIKQFYLGGKLVGDENAVGFINSNTDRNFGFGTYEEALLHSRHAPVYHYINIFKGYFSAISQELGLNYTAAGHGDDIPYCFDFPAYPEPPLGTQSYEFSRNLIQLWVSFAKNGKPETLLGTSEEWEPFSETSRKTLILDYPLMEVTDLYRKRMEFWESLRLRELEFGASSSAATRAGLLWSIGGVLFTLLWNAL